MSVYHRSVVAFLPLFAGVFLSHCETEVEVGSGSGVQAGVEIDGMSSETAKMLLAQVGERQILMSDYALMLRRMDRFERMRYQSEDRRTALLDEMINLELLSAEAKRRGLDQLPATKALVWQSMRDQVFAQLRGKLPQQSELPASEVAAFFSAHRSEFSLPESRRLAEFVFQNQQRASKALAETLNCNNECWGALGRRYFPAFRGKASSDVNNARPGLEVLGDLGFVRLKPQLPVKRGAIGTQLISQAVREAGFALRSDGEVHSELVKVGSDFHIVRRVSVNGAREPDLLEVDGMVRNRLLEQKFEAARSALLAKLEREIPVVIDEAALARISAPSPKDPQ